MNLGHIDGWLLLKGWDGVCSICGALAFEGLWWVGFGNSSGWIPELGGCGVLLWSAVDPEIVFWSQRVS